MTALREWPTSYQILADLFWAVVLRLRAYITGGSFAAIAFLSAKSSHYTSCCVGVAGFFVAGPFMAWREQYRPSSPTEIRDRLDDLIKPGGVLLNTWTTKKKKNCAENDGFPQQVPLQGNTSPWLIKT
jgi:hypothetical protein